MTLAVKQPELTEEQLLGNALCWNNIVDFTRQAFSIVSPEDKYVHGMQIDCVAEHLHALYEGDIKRLIINIPPRSLKSIMCTVAFPAWILGRNPRKRIITASYGQKLAMRHSMDTRLIMESQWYRQLFPNTIIARDQNEKSNFMTTQRGFRKATSMGGTILGDGGDILIADDLIKVEDALLSETIREKTNTWFDQGFMPRVNNPNTAKIIVVMQRLHSLDLTGHLIEKGGWHLLKIPAKAHKKIVIDLKGKQWKMDEGDLMQPDRLGKEILEQKRKELGDYAYAGQYLQEPVPPSGAEFKLEWFNFYQKLENVKNLALFLIVDPAGDKKTTTADYTAMMLWGLGVDRNYYLVDMIRDKMNTTERVNAIFEMQRKYSEITGRPVKVLYKSRSFIAELHNIKERMKLETYHFPLIEVKEKGNKNDRIRRIIPAAQEGRIYLPRSFSYVDYTKEVKDLTQSFLKQECALFPVAPHDDMLDATSELFNMEHSEVIRFPILRKQSHLANSNLPKSIWEM